MPRYCVNATMSVPAWLYLDADTPEQAREWAADYPNSDFEYDVASAEIEFNVTPAVELADDQ